MQKKIIIIIQIFFIIFFITGKVNAKPNIQHSIKIGGDNHLPPYMYVNDNGIYKGFSIDLIHALAIELGVDIELHPMPWYRIPYEMNKGEIEVILGMNKSESFSDIYTFSDPYLTISQGIFVRHDNKYIVNLEDLSSAVVAVQKGNVPQELLKYVNREALIFVDNQQQGILLLMMGKIDAFVGNRLVGLYTIQKWRQTNFIKLVGEPIEPVDYCLAVKKENKELIKIFNTGLKRIKANGIYEKIYKKWFGEIIYTPKELWQKIIYKLLAGLIFVLFIFLIIIRGNSLLKREVRKRTNELAKANKLLKEHNEKIQKEHKFKEQILDSVFHGVITFEKDGVVNFLNTEAKKLLSFFKCKGLIGLHVLETPIYKFIKVTQLLDVLEEGTCFINQEKVTLINNEEFVIGYSIYPLKDTNGELSGAILSFKDITQQKKIQENLIRKDKMQSLGQLVAVIAHEIRNPLMAIKTFIDIMPIKLDNNKFRQKLIEYVPKELDRLNQLVNDLLEYASPRPIQKEYFEINSLIKEVLALFNKKLKEKNIKLITNIEKINVFADRHQIKQVLINLLLNSIQAMKEQPDRVLKIEAKKENNNCIFELTDNGVGIPTRFINKVMDPFFTLKEGGSGLGLSICYQIIKEHGGEIDIKSKINEGTTVRIILPD